MKRVKILFFGLLIALIITCTGCDSEALTKDLKNSQSSVEKKEKKIDKESLSTKDVEKEEQEESDENENESVDVEKKSIASKNDSSSSVKSQVNSSNNSKTSTSNSSVTTASQTQTNQPQTPQQVTPQPQTEWEKKGVSKEEYENTPYWSYEEVYSKNAQDCINAVREIGAKGYRASWDYVVGRYVPTVGCYVEVYINGRNVYISEFLTLVK